jgi:hypothetical protein
MISYKALVCNIYHNGIKPDLDKLKHLIEEYGFGVVEKAPTQRSFSFDEVGVILSAKSRYAI